MEETRTKLLLVKLFESFFNIILYKNNQIFNLFLVGEKQFEYIGQWLGFSWWSGRFKFQKKIFNAIVHIFNDVTHQILKNKSGHFVTLPKWIISNEVTV